jgi:hypothetical protein
VWIDWNDNGVMNDGSDYYNYNSVGSSAGTSNYNNIQVPATATVGKKRMRLISNYTSRTNNPCYNGSWGETEDYAVEIIAYDDDAAISEIVSPKFIYCTTEQLLQVKVKNAGQNTLNSVVVTGEIATTGILGKIPIPPDTITNLNWAPFSGDTIIDLYNIGSTGYSLGDTITVWTTYPNGMTDGYLPNDTLSIVLRDGLKGTYLVGDTSKFYEIPSMDSVVKMMNYYGAVCDTTIFLLQDTTFNEQIELPSLIGSDFTAPIFFRGITDTAESVISSGQSSGSSNNFVVQFNGLDHVFMENLTIKNSSTNTTYNTVIAFADESNWVTLDNTKLEGNTNTTTSSSWSAVISNYQSNATGINNLVVKNSEIEGNAYGVYLNQNANDVTFMGNTFLSNSWQNADFYQVNDLHFSYNEFTGTTPNFYYLDLNQINGAEITHNILHPGNSNNPSDAIYMSTVNGTPANPVLVSNNMISHGQKWSTSAYSGIYMTNCNYVDVVNNNISIRYNNSNAYPLEIFNGGAINIYNNNLVNYGSGSSLFVSGNANIAQANHNNLYAATGTLAMVNNSGYINLTGYQAGTSFGSNSISVDPNFFEVGDVKGWSNLHVCNDALDAKGMAYAGLTDDIDGDVRNSNTPDIGADEFFGLNNLSVGTDFGLCPGDSSVLSFGVPKQGDLAVWNGTDTMSTYTVNMPGVYTLALSNDCGLALDTIEVITPDVVTLPNDTTICAGATLNMDATIAYGNKYEWNTNEKTAMKSVSSAGSFFITATDQWGCVTTDDITIDIAKVADLNKNMVMVCDFGSVELEVDAQPAGNETYTWSWSNGSGSSTASNIFELATSMNTMDTVYTSLTDRGCTTYDTAYVQVIASPKAVVTDSLSNYVYDVLTNTSTGDVHMWDFGDGNTSNLMLPSHLYQKGGTFVVTYTVKQSAFDCGEDVFTKELKVIATDVSEIDADAQVLIYPNPNNGSFVINMSDLNVTNAEVSVMDMKGSVVYTAQPTLNGGNATLQVDLTNVEAGMYIVSMKLDNKVVTERISVQ